MHSDDIVSLLHTTAVICVLLAFCLIIRRLSPQYSAH